VVTPAQANSLYSSLREKIVEHTFLSEVLRELWNRGCYTFEVSRAESDAFGYDVVVEYGRIVRHIQLKSKSERRPSKISISKTLADKPSGCVISVILDKELNIKSFYWFGGAPGRPLPVLEGLTASKRIRRDKDGKRPPRKNHVDAPIGRFEPIASVPLLLEKLFGDLGK
jgi:hypothetical protein